MRIFKILSFSVLPFIWLILVSCSQQVIDTTDIERHSISSPTKDSENVYIAWNGGIGGTGISGEDEFGIGGTGIIGTISGFGSIIVNGIHINYEPDQIVESPLGEKKAEDLSIGHVVAVEAKMFNGRLVAQKLIQQIALTGRVNSVDSLSGEIEVAGEKIVILPNSVGDSLVFDDISIGAQIAISGMRDSEALYATHISNISKYALPFTSGNVTAMKNGQIVLDGRLRFNFANKSQLNLSVGDFISIQNISASKKVDQTKLTINRIYGRMFDGRVNRTSVEGFFKSPKAVDETQNAFRKRHSERQIVFKIKDSKNHMKTIGSIQVDRRNWKKFSTGKSSKNYDNNPKEYSSNKINSSTDQQKDNLKNVKNRKANYGKDPDLLGVNGNTRNKER